MAEFWIKVADVLPWIDSTLTDAEDNPVDIENADVFFTLRPVRSGEPLIDRVAADNDQNGDGTDGTLGQVHYGWTAGDTDTAGGYYGEWTVEFPNGAGAMTFPNNGYDTIAIVDNLEAVGS